MVRHFCDMCGKELTTKYYLSFSSEGENGRVSLNPLDGCELCRACAQRIKDLINNGDKGARMGE